MIYVGCDPGTADNIGLALMFGPHLRVAVARCGPGTIAERAPRVRYAIKDAFAKLLHGTSLDEAMTLCLEWQRPLPTDKNPRNICDLAAFAGIALASIQEVFDEPEHVLLPVPDEWKGTVAKHQKQNRIVEAVGLPRMKVALELANLPVPLNLGRFTSEFTGLASHVIDAVGLALWAKERTELFARVNARRFG